MATLRDIKRRIIGIKNTQQITKAMKMVAAARLRRAQDNIINARPYSRKISEVLSLLLSIEKNINNPFLQERKVDNLAIVVVTSDRGLCGSFNVNVIRKTEELIHNDYKQLYDNGKVQLYCVGKKGFDYFSKRNYLIANSFQGIFSHLKFEFASGIIKELSQKFLECEVDKVLLVYNEFKSIIQQKTVIEQLLPIQPFSQNELNQLLTVDFIYEPNKTGIINFLLPKHLNAQMWRTLLESYAAELAARMTAMDMATENAKELIRSLQLTYNKVRQATITKEIIEIVSGANALKEG
ncbi:MAG: ATP synthase F1 subunit gamma [Melioribacter sp.]|uniref:ATP synthase F1 subunit gamma n=1 Tax=Rosettibacter primus TaxID=3111523 RepID=UPI00247BA041|nr:ATP synthase F1 subunit gamma [Melioribacter sp.]